MSKYFKITVCPLFQIEGNLIYFEFVCFFPKKGKQLANWPKCKKTGAAIICCNDEFEFELTWLLTNRGQNNVAKLDHCLSAFQVHKVRGPVKVVANMTW